MFNLKKINKKSLGYDIVTSAISMASGIGFGAIANGLMGIGLAWTVDCFKSRPGKLFVIGCGMPAMFATSVISALACQAITKAEIDILADQYNLMADMILASGEDEDEDKDEPEPEEEFDAEEVVILDTAPSEIQAFIANYAVASENVPNIVDAIRQHIKNSDDTISVASFLHYMRVDRKSIVEFVKENDIDISDYGWYVDLMNNELPFKVTKHTLMTNDAYFEVDKPIKLSHFGICDVTGKMIANSMLSDITKEN